MSAFIWSNRRRECTVAYALFATLSFTYLTACTSSPGIQSARKGDLEDLRDVLAHQELESAQVRRLAEETLKREVRVAKDREDRSFIRSLRACAQPLADALSDRGEKLDGVAAEAQLMLWESGNFRGTPKDFENHEDGAFRAIAARASKRDGDARRKYFSDPDERVRRAALLTAAEVGDPSDAGSLLEVSRVDPDPFCRNRAFQALGRIGGEQVANALSDRFESGTEEEQLAIVDAWSSEALYKTRGRKRLTRLLTHKEGFPALHAAQILSRDEEETVRNQGLTRLLRFAREGSAQERRMALRLLPGSEPLTTQALVLATKGDDQNVALIAWARLLQSPKYRQLAHQRLTAWAESKDPLSYEARAALSAFGDSSVLPLMKKQMTHTDPETRRLAGSALLRLREFSQAAPLLADVDANVRRSIACQVIATPYRPRFDENGR